MRRYLLAIAIIAIATGPAGAGTDDDESTTCLLVESAARSHGLPLEFFARVIWQESRFNPAAVGPLTRSGARAEGIAQFMPGTAAERELLDPFDPVQALPEAAEFLHELQIEFGNLGLAAAAYNAGSQRVRDWLAGTRSLPAETRHYVRAVTGHPVEDWRDAADGTRKPDKSSDCTALMARLQTAPNAFVAALEERVRTAERQPWGVQLAASFSRVKALGAYARALERFEEVIGERDPLVLRRLNRSRGTRPLYEVRVGAETRGEANGLCARIRQRHGACVVLRTR